MTFNKKTHDKHYMQLQYIKAFKPSIGSFNSTLQQSREKYPNKDCPTTITRGATHCGLAIYIKKYLKAKKELWKLKYCHHAKI
jgi:hypothetical protein